MSYNNSNPITDKFIFSDGSIRQLDGTLIREADDFNIKRYNQATPIPNKFLHSDGTIKDKYGNVIEQTSEFNVKRYNQSTPIPAKFLHSDGTVDENIGSGGADLKYKLYAYEVDSVPGAFGYTEEQNPEVGDVLLLSEDMSVGKITDPSQLKQKFIITEVHEGGIIYAVKDEGDSPIHFTRSDENDYEESITDIKGTLDVVQSGLLVAEKGKVMKSVDIQISGGVNKLFCYKNSDSNFKIYFFKENPIPNIDTVITTMFVSSGIYNPSFRKDFNTGPGGRIILDSDVFYRYSDGDIEL